MPQYNVPRLPYAMETSFRLPLIVTFVSPKLEKVRDVTHFGQYWSVSISPQELNNILCIWGKELCLLFHTIESQQRCEMYILYIFPDIFFHLP